MLICLDQLLNVLVSSNPYVCNDQNQNSAFLLYKTKANQSPNSNDLITIMTSLIELDITSWILWFRSKPAFYRRFCLVSPSSIDDFVYWCWGEFTEWLKKVSKMVSYFWARLTFVRFCSRIFVRVCKCSCRWKAKEAITAFFSLIIYRSIIPEK